MALIVAGTRGVAGNWASLRAARIAAAISRTRLRPSSTERDSTLSPFVRLCCFLGRRVRDLVRLGGLTVFALMKGQAGGAEGLAAQLAALRMWRAERGSAVVTERCCGSATRQPVGIVDTASLNDSAIKVVHAAGEYTTV
jgi:hypothetical protein